MPWTDFTLKNVKQFEKVKINIGNNNSLLHSLKMERNRIKNFIRRNKHMYIYIRHLKSDYKDIINKKIILYTNVDWVDSKSVLDDLPNLPNIYEFTWITPNDNVSTNSVNNNENKMYIQTTVDKNKKIVKRIKFLIFINEYIKYKTNNTNKRSMIFLVLSNLERFFPEDNQIINVKHVNGGYTNQDIIFVWRYEEFEKVLLHEIIHYFDMDSRNTNIETKLNINGPHNYYEAKTDFWGIFYHLIYLSLITKVKIKYLLELELSFIQNQAMALNNHFKLDNWRDNINTSIVQTTPALSYYILKYLLFKYFLINTNDISEIEDYNIIIKKITNIGFEKQPYIKLKSSRMSLLQLD
jgi:hypothetical protein